MPGTSGGVPITGGQFDTVRDPASCTFAAAYGSLLTKLTVTVAGMSSSYQVAIVI
jgi:hypothetical protein